MYRYEIRHRDFKIGKDTIVGAYDSLAEATIIFNSGISFEENKWYYLYDTQKKKIINYTKVNI